MEKLKEILSLEKPATVMKENKEEIFKLIPELKICDGFDQHNDYHQYDVLEHIFHVVDGVENHYLLRIAALFHDIGKPNCFVLDEKGVGHFYGHWEESNKIFNQYVHLFDLTEDEVKLINDLIFYHDLYINDDNWEILKDVFKERISLLISLKKADVKGQNPKYIDRLEVLNKLSNAL